MRCSLVPRFPGFLHTFLCVLSYLNNKLEESEYVEEEAGLVGDQEVQHHARVSTHDAQQLREPAGRGGVEQTLQRILNNNIPENMFLHPFFTNMRKSLSASWSG